MKLQFMVGEGLSPGHVLEHVIAKDDECVITYIVQVTQGQFALRQRDRIASGEDIDGILAGIEKGKLHSRTRSSLRYYVDISIRTIKP